ncbi:hypothetical protein [Brachybacterium sp. GPGPB12]|uniref:hypothetical protein n=1 Tax=Brachybacterium sp. GPGPB12 TaxID=3023517 RepID=UPI00313430F9
MLWRHLAGIVLGALAWAVRRRGLPALEAGRAVTAAATGGAVVLLAAYSVLGAMPLWVEAPREVWSAVFGARYAPPLVLGLVALVALGAARPHRAPSTGASLAPRTWRTFLDARWLAALVIAPVLVLVPTLAAGMASRPDEDGEYTRYVVDVGSGTLGTGIYGWHHSALPLVLLVPLGAATWWALSGIARPPLAEAEPADAANRRPRARTSRGSRSGRRCAPRHDPDLAGEHLAALRHLLRRGSWAVLDQHAVRRPLGRARRARGGGRLRGLCAVGVHGPDRRARAVPLPLATRAVPS